LATPERYCVLSTELANCERLADNDVVCEGPEMNLVAIRLDFPKNMLV
jgi:hypothetical protein